MKKDAITFAIGNEALAEEALAAEARFYVGYPITPSSEVAEFAPLRLPKLDGMYIQMEDEIGLINDDISQQRSLSGDNPDF